MNYQQILQKYVSDGAANLLETGKILNFLKTIGIRESYLYNRCLTGCNECHDNKFDGYLFANPGK
ncbi:MAG: hypothetical protein JXR70_17340 [Spirochaetales bacterium]|nr:hypothetical protein [Spirochaetales bacterium]